MSLFTDILKRYEATNTSLGSDKCTTHSYGEVYNNIFDNYKNTTGNILEIGISGGFGLCAYTDYFQNAQIYGIDIEDICTTKIKNHERVHLYFGDACNPQTIQHFNVMYDIIVEDASHRPEHQIQHFKDYCNFVNKGGVYIIEDIDQNYKDILYDELSKVADMNGFSMHFADLRMHKGRYDDILFIFYKL